MDNFDDMTTQFTAMVTRAANWKDNYFGARHATRIAAAIVELEAAITMAKANPEVAKQCKFMQEDRLQKLREWIDEVMDPDDARQAFSILDKGTRN